MARRSAILGPEELTELLDRVDAGSAERADTKAVVKHFLDVLAQRHPGKSVEVRVPPFGAVQAIEGARHTRGTPPAVVEMDASTWIELARGRLAWADARPRVRASGERSDLSPLLPLL